MKRVQSALKEYSQMVANHTEQMFEVKEKTETIQDSLDRVAVSVTAVQEASSAALVWPHVVFPGVAIVVGSYGLPASTARNLVLMIIGMSQNWYKSRLGPFTDITLLR
jgi:hypothetical protein